MRVDAHPVGRQLNAAGIGHDDEVRSALRPGEQRCGSRLTDHSAVEKLQRLLCDDQTSRDADRARFCRDLTEPE